MDFAQGIGHSRIVRRVAVARSTRAWVHEHAAADAHTGGAQRRRYGENMGTLADVKRDWRAFKRDEPGHRFQHQHERLTRKSLGLRVAMAIGGVLLLSLGVVLGFVPGPGLPLLVFGLALLAGLSGSLARTLDRAEPVLRDKAKQLGRGWHRLSRGSQIFAGALAVVGVAAVGLGAYRLIT